MPQNGANLARLHVSKPLSGQAEVFKLRQDLGGEDGFKLPQDVLMWPQPVLKGLQTMPCHNTFFTGTPEGMEGCCPAFQQ